MTSYIFEIFCIDSNGQSEIKNEKSLIQGLSYSSKLWSDEMKDIYDTGKWSITDKKLGLHLKIKSVDTSKVLTGFFESAYNIKIESKDFESIETFRLKILKHLRDKLKFTHIRILSDDISAHIAQELYPAINNVENLLRKYLTKFFIQRVGLEWWEATATKDMIQKVKERKTDRKDLFSQLSDADVSLADFDDLGELIYKQSSGFNNPEKVVEKVLSINNGEELENFKSELQGNYTKYFKDFFRDKDFESKWKELYKIRNKVAHHGFFYKVELERGRELITSLSQIISDAENNIDELVFSIEEKEAIHNAIEAISEDSIIASNMDIEEEEEEEKTVGLKVLGKIKLPENYRYSGFYRPITESEMLRQLTICEQNRTVSYIGLRWFVTIHLAGMNYSIGLSYSLVNILVDKGRIELYDIDSESYPVKAIKLKK